MTTTRLVLTGLAASITSLALAHTAAAEGTDCIYDAGSVNAIMDTNLRNNPTLAAQLGVPLVTYLNPEGTSFAVFPPGGFYRVYTNGVYWYDTCSDYWEINGQVFGLIRNKYDQLGGPTSALRFPITTELETVSGDGRVNYFEVDHFDNTADGAIYWSATSHAWEMQGIIFQQFLDYNETISALRYPTSDERACTQTYCATGGRENQMQNGFMEYAPIAGFPLQQNQAWGLLNVNIQSPQLQLQRFGAQGVYVSSTTWPGNTVRISVNTVDGRMVQTTLPVVNRSFSVMLSIGLGSGIAGVGAEQGHLIATVEATTMSGDDPGFTKLSSVPLN